MISIHPIDKQLKIDMLEGITLLTLTTKRQLNCVSLQHQPNKLEFNIRMQFVKAMISIANQQYTVVSLEQQTYFKSFVTWLDNTKKEL